MALRDGVLVRALLFVITLSMGTQYVLAATQPSSIEACAVALTPLNDVITLSDRQKYAWLDLITEETYEQSKVAIKASADVDLLDLIKLGDAEADYNTFNEKRRKYLEKHQGVYARDLNLSIYTQHLPPTAHQSWLGCVQAVSQQVGLWAWFSQETSTTAIANFRYFGTPGTTVNLTLDVTGGTPAQTQFALVHGGNTTQTLTRTDQSSIIVSLNAMDNAGNRVLGTSAASAYPTPSGVAELYLSPYLMTPATASPCSAGDNCSLCIRNFTAIVDVSKPVNAAPALVLTASGNGAVAPGNGPFSFQLARALDDVKLTGPAKMELQVGASKITVATINAQVGACSNPSLQFPGSMISVRFPEPVYQWVTDTNPTTTQVDLRRGVEYQRMGGDIACPPRGNKCGDLYAAEVLLREGAQAIPIDHIDNITLVSTKDSGHWYPCGDGLCDSTGDFTLTSNKTSPKCFPGGATCWIWRHTDDGMPATDTFAITYHKKVFKCTKNCPAPAAGQPNQTFTPALSRQ